MNTKNIGIACIVLAIIVAIGVSVSNTKSGTKEIVTIGVIAPLTGNVAFLGEGMKNAAELSLQEINKDPMRKHEYKLIFEDDAFDVKKTATAAQKLITIDKADAILTIASAAANVVNPLAEKHKVIQFGTASDPNAGKGYFNFLHWTPPSEESKVLTQELQNKGYKKVAVFGANIQGVIAIIDSFKNDIKSTDIQIVSESIFNFGEKDFRTQISKAQASNPDIYVLLSFSPETELIAEQMKAMGVKVPITAVESFELTEKPELFEGLWYVNAADPTNTFNELYRTTFTKAPSMGAANAYDIVKLIYTAAESTNNPTAENIADALYSTRYEQGALGNLHLNQDGLVVTKAVVRKIENGKPVTVK